MKFIKLILLIIIILLLSVPLADASTEIERDLVFKEGELICRVYKKDCDFVEVEDKGMYAYSTGLDMIFISSKLRETFTKEQLRGVVYHEVGHVVLEHVYKLNKFHGSCGNECNLEVMNNLRRRYEFQADRFAVLVAKYLHIKQDLKGGLIILTPIDKYYTTHPSHPSTADRIRKIEELSK